MILAQHGINSLRREQHKEFLFYSDFSDYRQPTLEDHPIIGGVGIYTANLGLRVSSSGGPYNDICGTIDAGSSFPSMAQRYSLAENSSVKTYEIWVDSRNSSFDSGYIFFGNHPIFILNRKFVFQIIGDGITVDLYNGSTNNTQSVPNLVQINNSYVSGWNHFAYVSDGSDCYLYVNGVKCIHAHKSSGDITSSNTLFFTGTGGTSITRIAYPSVRRGNRSSGNESFPVPGAPYL